MTPSRALAVLIFLSACSDGEIDSPASSNTEQVGTIRASIGGEAKTFSVVKYTGTIKLSDCVYRYNTSNPSDGSILIVGRVGDEKFTVFIATPVAGGSWSSDQYHYLGYSIGSSGTAVETSSQNAGGVASIQLTAFPGTTGTIASGTFSGTLKSADGSRTAIVTEGQFSCTMTAN
ncbi:MAG: hypothetical protein HY901_07275 [Deltaproteobacteria bacterium]|nr:hypothetical protein [Deltaproteobacteria bacterium]